MTWFLSSCIFTGDEKFLDRKMKQCATRCLKELFVRNYVALIAALSFSRSVFRSSYLLAKRSDANIPNSAIVKVYLIDIFETRDIKIIKFLLKNDKRHSKINDKQSQLFYLSFK